MMRMNLNPRLSVRKSNSWFLRTFSIQIWLNERSTWFVYTSPSEFGINIYFWLWSRAPDFFFSKSNLLDQSRNIVHYVNSFNGFSDEWKKGYKKQLFGWKKLEKVYLWDWKSLLWTLKMTFLQQLKVPVWIKEEEEVLGSTFMHRKILTCIQS